MKLTARTRRFYWRHIRQYRYEICGRPNHLYKTIEQGCGRPVGAVWRAPSAIWNYVVAGIDQTAYTVREGAAGGPIMERAEGVGGVLCLSCFDCFAKKRNLSLQWTSSPL